MKRFLTAFIFCAAAAASVGACDSGHWGYYYGYGPGAGPYTCGQYSSCGSCTPVAGCGWCAFEGGGACLTYPGDCARKSTFTWTWEPEGCPAEPGQQDGSASLPRDAGSLSPEAGKTAPVAADQ